MTPVEVQSAISSGTVAYVEVTLTAPAQPGEVVALVVAESSAVLSTHTPSGGDGTWTEVEDHIVTGLARRILAYTTVVVNATDTFRYTTESTSTIRRIAVFRFSTADPTTPVTGTPGTSVTTGTAHAASTTPAVADGCLIGVTTGSTGVYTADATFTLATSWGTTAALAAWKAITSTDEVTMTTTTSAAEDAGTVLFGIAVGWAAGDGVLASSVPMATTAAEGTVEAPSEIAESGTIVSTVPMVTTAGVGAVAGATARAVLLTYLVLEVPDPSTVISGTLASAVPFVTTAAEGDVTLTAGPLASVVPFVTTALTGTVEAMTTGAIAQTVPFVTTTGTGTVETLATPAPQTGRTGRAMLRGPQVGYVRLES